MTSRVGHQSSAASAEAPNPMQKFMRPEEDVLKDLARCTETRRYLTDTGFREGLAALRSGDPEDARRLMGSDALTL